VAMRRWLCRDRIRPTLLTAVIAGVAVLLAACGSSSGTPSGSPGGSTSSGGNSASFPATITDCGRTLTFKAPPQRVVILSPVIARDMIALGLQNRIIGQSGTDFMAPYPQTAKVPVLSKSNATSTEVLLGARPDLVISDLVYRLTPSQGGASLARLQQAGVLSYVDTAGCSTTESGGRVADAFTDLENLGKIFGMEPQARALVAKLQAQLADVERRVAGLPKVTVFKGTLYSNQYYPTAGIGLDSLGLAGGTSIFPDVQNADASVSKEEITARNPQAIIDSFSGPTNQQETIASLKKTFPTVTAIKDNRIYFINYVAAEEPGSAIEIVDATEQIAKYLHPAAFAGS
jgi:iron complex transport system substrate-binding protein